MEIEPSENPIDAAAFIWAIRADGGLTRPEQMALSRWLAQDVRHCGAYERAKAICLYAQRANELGGAFGAASLATRPLQPSRDAATYTFSLAPASRLSRRQFLAASGSVAAAGALIMMPTLSPSAKAVSYATARGEMRKLRLGDGSAVTLNTDTRIDVRIDGYHRGVTLLQGEALFEIRKDADRPFVVDASSFAAQAVETTFAIQRLVGGVPTVLVLTGDVSILTIGSLPLRASARMRVQIPARGRIRAEHVAATDIERQLAWRDGKIAFENLPLSEAIDAFSRYGDTDITIEDQDLRRLTVTGAFSADNPVGFAEAVGAAFDLDVVAHGRGVKLRKRN